MSKILPGEAPCKCHQCGHRFDSDKGQVTVTFQLGDNALAQLEGLRQIRLCPECGRGLETWMGRRFF